MKWFALALLLLYSLDPPALAQEMKVPEDYQWKNRLILLFAPAKDDPLLRQQYTHLTTNRAGLTERDLLVFQVTSDQVIGYDTPRNGQMAQLLRAKYEVAPDEFRAILIGKDGSEKLRKRELLKTEELYSVIDAMPMRRREMRENERN